MAMQLDIQRLNAEKTQLEALLSSVATALGDVEHGDVKALLKRAAKLREIERDLLHLRVPRAQVLEEVVARARETLRLAAELPELHEACPEICFTHLDPDQETYLHHQGWTTRSRSVSGYVVMVKIEIAAKGRE